MSIKRAFIGIVGVVLAAALPAAAEVPGLVVVGSEPEGLAPAELQGSLAGFDYCAKDSSSVFRLASETGAYVLYHFEAQKLSLLEQGRGTVTQSENTIEFSHALGSIRGFDTIQATFNTGANSAHVDVFGADETHDGTFPKFTIDDINVSNDSVCAQYGSSSALNEGVVRYFQSPSGGAVGAANTLSEATILQHYKLNDDFSGHLTRLTYLYSGKTGAPRQSLGFFPVVYSDNNGTPGSRLYRGTEIRYPDVPANPSGYVVQQRLQLAVSKSFWVGAEYNPQTDPLYFNFSSNPASVRADVALCDPTGPCAIVNQPGGSFSQIRNLYQSVDFTFSTQAGSVGFTPIVLFSDVRETVASKCRGAYVRVDNTADGLFSTYTEGGSVGLTETGYDEAWARVTRLGDAGAKGLDGGKFTNYNGTAVYGLSYTVGSSLKFCSRPIKFIDWTCRATVGYQPASGSYTRIVPVKAGFEQSYGNAPDDTIDRFQWTLGGSGWSSQTLKSVTSTSGIVNPEFGGGWYGAVGYRIGDDLRTGYYYKNVQGNVEMKSYFGDQELGTVHIASDILNGFNPSEASQWTGACSWGVCTMGRYETKTGNNLLDVLDFNQPTPSVETYTLGKGLKGIGFGRAAFVRGYDAWYANFESTPTAGQSRLQLTNFKLDTDLKFSLSYDYAATGSTFPLNWSAEDGDITLSHAYGVSIFRKDAGGCTILPILGRGKDNDALGGPCTDVATVGGR